MDWYRTQTCKGPKVASLEDPGPMAAYCYMGGGLLPYPRTRRLITTATVVHTEIAPTLHWCRNHHTAAGDHKPLPEIVFSLSAQTVLKGVLEDNYNESPLAMLRGHEDTLLPMIAGYCGLAMIDSCFCCSNEPIRMCAKQGMLFRTVAVMPASPTSTDKHDPKAETTSASTTVPPSLFSLLDQEHFLFQAESVVSSVRTIHRDSGCDRGARCSFGEGYIICTSQGFFSSLWEFEWEALASMDISLCKTRMHPSYHQPRHKYVLTLSSVEGGHRYMGYRKGWVVISSGDDGEERIWGWAPVWQEQRQPRCGTKATFFFRSASTVKSMIEILAAKRGGAERRAVRLGRVKVEL